MILTLYFLRYSFTFFLSLMYFWIIVNNSYINIHGTTFSKLKPAKKDSIKYGIINFLCFLNISILSCCNLKYKAIIKITFKPNKWLKLPDCHIKVSLKIGKTVSVRR